MPVALAALVLPLAAAAAQPRASRSPAPQPAATLETVRAEINTLEKDLIESRESQMSAANQLKKIRRLLVLQQKEITLSKQRMTELARGLSDLSVQKQALLDNIQKNKVSLRVRLRELHRLTDEPAFDAAWLRDLEAHNQKVYFLSKTLRKQLADVDRLRSDVLQAQGLELRILEEKNKLDYYAQELSGQMAILSANEDVQKEIIRTNRTSRLEALSRMRSLKESEREIEHMISSFKAARPAAPEPSAPVPVTRNSAIQKPSDSFAGFLKGKLPLPVEGNVLSAFGKSYNAKTNLLTFQKGITLGSAAASDVRAVSAGKVVFAGPLRNYGLIAIVEHPGQYYTLYGQMGSVAVAEGNVIKQGDTLGKE
ncbi:MAG: peptidoglycan DD-metalloendopeptidase family protein [Deltaproteobacteria bacterium]|nr:peptidoglycan DD-metalloendopeptidase family protein [Deltaproteobacteria bacterium]